MAEYSEPEFLSVEDQQSIPNDKTIAYCRCPLPVLIEMDGVLGGYYHVVEYEKKYVCKKCGTEFSVGKHFPR